MRIFRPAKLSTARTKAEAYLELWCKLNPGKRALYRHAEIEKSYCLMWKNGRFYRKKFKEPKPKPQKEIKPFFFDEEVP